MTEELLRMILDELGKMNEHLAEIADSNAISIKLIQYKLDERLDNITAVTKEVKVGNCCCSGR